MTTKDTNMFLILFCHLLHDKPLPWHGTLYNFLRIFLQLSTFFKVIYILVSFGEHCKTDDLLLTK